MSSAPLSQWKYSGIHHPPYRGVPGEQLCKARLRHDVRY
jgi:hypothetical protein